MPKVYSEEEKQDIIRRLKEEANNLMLERGVKKTTVDELVKRVGIPKGTFYLFYQSKEMLLFDCSQDLHHEVDACIYEKLNRIITENKVDLTKKNAMIPYVDEVTDAILEGMSLIRTSCLKVLMNPESMNLILSKLDKDLLAKHMDHENVMDLSGLETMAKKKGINVDELAAAFTMILFGGMYTDVIGEKNLEGSTRMLVRGLVKQIFE